MYTNGKYFDCLFLESRSHSQSRTLKTSLAISATSSSDAYLEQLCRVVMKFDDSKVASKKQRKKLSNFVAQLRDQQTSTRTVLEILESVEVKVNDFFEKSGRLLDQQKLDNWRTAFASIKAKYLREARKFGKNDQQSHQSQRKSKTGPHRTMTATIDYKYLDSSVCLCSYMISF